MAVLALSSGAASAAQYVSQLEYSQNGYSAAEFGTVTLTEYGTGAGAYVNVLVELLAPITNFVDTGAHYMFAFNLADPTSTTGTSAVTLVQPNVDINAPGNTDGYTFLKNGNYSMSPFQGFSEVITYDYQGSGNGNNSAPPPLQFNVTNTNGITFVGAGNHFQSTTATSSNIGGYTTGWWFAADVQSSATSGINSNTFTVAARDFCEVGVSCGPGVPEPTSWALMLMGFGGLGAVLRSTRRRARVAMA